MITNVTHKKHTHTSFCCQYKFQLLLYFVQRIIENVHNKFEATMTLTATKYTYVCRFAWLIFCLVFCTSSSNNFNYLVCENNGNNENIPTRTKKCVFVHWIACIMPWNVTRIDAFVSYLKHTAVHFSSTHTHNFFIFRRMNLGYFHIFQACMKLDKYLWHRIIFLHSVHEGNDPNSILYIMLYIHKFASKPKKNSSFSLLCLQQLILRLRFH